MRWLGRGPSTRWRLRAVGSVGRRECCGRRVHDPVAEGANLTACQAGMVSETDEFDPGDQICCRHNDFEAGTVRLERVKRQVAQAAEWPYCYRCTPEIPS